MMIMSRFFSKSIGILTQKCKYCKIFSPRILTIYNPHRKIEFYMYSFRFCAPAFFLFSPFGIFCFIINGFLQSAGNALAKFLKSLYNISKTEKDGSA